MVKNITLSFVVA
jgi:hypothetical protein